MDFLEQYNAALEQLNEKYPYFLTNVLNIGAPRTVQTDPEKKGMDTAAIEFNLNWTPGDPLFWFVFNTDFAATLTVGQTAFVLAHETFHVILEHHRLWRFMKNGGWFHEELLNIAGDCVINDYMVEVMGFTDEPAGLCHGLNYIGRSTANMTVTTVYNTIIRQMNEEGWNRLEREDKLNDDHKWMTNEEYRKFTDLADKLPRELEEMLESELAGVQSGYRQRVTKIDLSSFNWRKLLRVVNPDIEYRAPTTVAWNRRPRKLGGMPDVFLPVSRVGWKGVNARAELPCLVMALDTSGSIEQADVYKFMALAKAVPPTHINLFLITFSDHAEVLDLNEPTYVSGGTSFASIQEYIETKVVPEIHHYPKAVVVVTDGDGAWHNHRPSPEQQKSWTWLIKAPTPRKRRHRRWWEDREEKKKKKKKWGLPPPDPRLFGQTFYLESFL